MWAFRTLNLFDICLFLWYKGTYILPYTGKSLHTITLWAPWTTWWQYPSMFCVSFTEILDYGFTFSQWELRTDSMLVLDQRDCCLAAQLIVVSILQSGPSPSFLHQAVFQYLCHGKYHQLIIKALEGAALKVIK